MPLIAVFPDRDDLPEVPPFDADYVCSVEWAWGGGPDTSDRRDEYWLSRSDNGEWLLWISGEDEDGDACHIVYVASRAALATPAKAAADLLVAAWRAEGHGRFAFVTGFGLLDADALARLSESVWGPAPS